MLTYPVTKPPPPGNGKADPSSRSAPLLKMSKYPVTVSSFWNDASIEVRAALLVIYSPGNAHDCVGVSTSKQHETTESL